MASSVITKTGLRFQFPWMFGREYDILFFFLPAILGVVLFFSVRFSPLGLSALWSILLLEAFGAGAFHWGPTWFAYFDSKNRESWKSQPLKFAVFFVAPLIVLPLCILGSIYIPWVITLITMLWALQHLIQQNIGILLLYHNQNRGEAIVDRTIEMRSLQAPSIFFAAILYWRHFFGSPSFWVYKLIGIVLFVIAVYFVSKYLLEFARQVRNGAAVNVPALLFWALSYLSFLPCAYLGNKPEDCLLIPLTMHWFQYIGLNYMLVRNKYVESQENISNLPVPKVSPILLFMVTGAVGMGILAFIKVGMHMKGANPLVIQVLAGTYMGIANLHYLHDAFLWRFREEHARKTILPFLMSYRKKQQSPAA
ncbi:MAG: hypothetical protein K2Y39_01330 [Candidatus Obscuribacterales bacterium]|nr:hypothetical protein [Candidatus Obscuribacterales bacterium]